LGDGARGLPGAGGRGASDRRRAGAAPQAVGLRTLPAGDTTRVRRRGRWAVRDPRGVIAAVPEGRAVGLLLRRRDRAPLQRELARGHAGRRSSVRAVPSIAADALSRRFLTGPVAAA